MSEDRKSVYFSIDDFADSSFVPQDEFEDLLGLPNSKLRLLSLDHFVMEASQYILVLQNGAEPTVEALSKDGKLYSPDKAILSAYVYLGKTKIPTEIIPVEADNQKYLVN